MFLILFWLYLRIPVFGLSRCRTKASCAGGNCSTTARSSANWTIQSRRKSKFVSARAPKVRAGLALAREGRALPNPFNPRNPRLNLVDEESFTPQDYER